MDRRRFSSSLKVEEKPARLTTTLPSRCQGVTVCAMYIPRRCQSTFDRRPQSLHRLSKAACRSRESQQTSMSSGQPMLAITHFSSWSSAGRQCDLCRPEPLPCASLVLGGSRLTLACRLHVCEPLLPHVYNTCMSPFILHKWTAYPASSSACPIN